jgi:3-hydroxyisobutyrate dehydrogenase-like beta-hydroxyacid dehydrogenase
VQYRLAGGSGADRLRDRLVTIHNLAAAEAIVIGEMAGLDPALVFDVIADSAGSSHMFQMRGPMTVAGLYDLHCPTPLFTAAAQFYLLASREAARQTPARPAPF